MLLTRYYGAGYLAINSLIRSRDYCFKKVGELLAVDMPLMTESRGRGHCRLTRSSLAVGVWVN